MFVLVEMILRIVIKSTVYNFLIKNSKVNVNMDITKIYLENGNLRSMPKEFGQLTMLQTLSLYNNKLKSIPKELGQLSMLQELSLYNNQLQSIPKEIGLLTMLQRLHLQNN